MPEPVTIAMAAGLVLAPAITKVYDAVFSDTKVQVEVTVAPGVVFKKWVPESRAQDTADSLAATLRQIERGEPVSLGQIVPAALTVEQPAAQSAPEARSYEYQYADQERGGR